MELQSLTETSETIDAKNEETGELKRQGTAQERCATEALRPSPDYEIKEYFYSASSKSVIVTGGAGYVGSMLIRRLLEEHYRVICIDNLRYGGSALLEVWDHPCFEFWKVDVRDYPRVERIIERSTDCYAIVHLAAIVGDPACRLEPKLAESTNLDSSIHLIETAVQANIPRFVFASTCSNYGRMTESGGFVDEDSPLIPVSLYAELKVAVEDYILNQMGRRDSFCPTCLRFATVYGISPRMRFDLTVNEFTKELALGRELVIFGEQFWRPYCYVGDLARAIVAVLSQPYEKVAYNVFNVGDTGENYTKKMIADALLTLMPDSRIKYVQKNEDPRDYRVNFDRIRNELGFRILKRVPQGMYDISRSIGLGIIDNADDPRYYNTPVKMQIGV